MRLDMEKCKKGCSRLKKIQCNTRRKNYVILNKIITIRNKLQNIQELINKIPVNKYILAKKR